MNLVKWFRKNNKMLMAVFVVMLMLAFIGGSYIRYLTNKQSAHSQTVAYYGDSKKITNFDIGDAQFELTVLREIGADYLLKNVTNVQFNAPDLQGLMLGELLFFEKNSSAYLNRAIQQLVRSKGYNISVKMINDIYRQPIARNDIYWILLTREAAEAGVRTSEQAAKRNLEKWIPQLATIHRSGVGFDYASRIAAIVNKYHVSEEKVVNIFAKLLSVLQYANIVCSNQNITVAQLQNMISRERRYINAEVIRVNSKLFVDSAPDPTDEQIKEHFEKYKNNPQGRITQDNPWGFGYKLDDRVRIEYFAVKRDEVAKIVTVPTPEEAEEYYQRNINNFTQQVPSDPNDPNSPATTVTLSYASQASNILDFLLQRKVSTKANKILQDAKSLIEAELGPQQDSDEPLTDERYKKLVADYADVKAKIETDYSIRIYSGMTGLLSVRDIQSDKYLGGMGAKGYGNNIVPLGQVFFAVDGIDKSDLGVFDVPKPRLYETTGPFTNYQSSILMLARIVEVSPSHEPEDIDTIYTKDMIDVGDPEASIAEIFSVREKIISDLSMFGAMTATGEKAQELINLADEQGWEKALETFNKNYSAQNEFQDEPNAFSISELNNATIPTMYAIETINTIGQGGIFSDVLYNSALKERMLMDQIYGLLAEDANSLTSPTSFEYKPTMSYIVVKDLSVSQIDASQYEQSKSRRAFQYDFIESQSVALVHYNPDSILKRTRFRRVEFEETPTESADVNSQ